MDYIIIDVDETTPTAPGHVAWIRNDWAACKDCLHNDLCPGDDEFIEVQGMELVCTRYKEV